MNLFEKFQKQIEIALDMQREAIRDGSTLAHGLIEAGDGGFTIIAFMNDFMESPKSRNALAANMLAKMAELHAKVSVFCADTWYAKLPPDTERSSLPDDMNQWPPELREEAVICVVNAFGHRGEFATQIYTRDLTGKPVFGPLQIGAGVLWNRFMFDLTLEHLLVMRAGAKQSQDQN